MNLEATKKNITAIILCGGEGQRLRPITEEIPKPLIKIKNNPILYYIIEHLKKYNITKYVIATGYKSNKIEEYMSQEFSNIDYKIVNSGDTDILSRIKKCLKYIDGDIILNYGDTISDININEFITFYQKNHDSVIISSYPIAIPFGVMKIGENNQVLNFKEKPVLEEVMNIGNYYIPSKFKDSLLKHNNLLSLIDSLVKENDLKCYQHKGIHITINTLAELNNAEENIKKIF